MPPRTFSLGSYVPLDNASLTDVSRPLDSIQAVHNYNSYWQKLGLAGVLIGTVCKLSNLGGDKMVAASLKIFYKHLKERTLIGQYLGADSKRSLLRADSDWSMLGADSNWSMLVADSNWSILGSGLQFVNTWERTPIGQYLGADSNWSILGSGLQFVNAGCWLQLANAGRGL